jgi:hypothetical protein
MNPQAKAAKRRASAKKRNREDVAAKGASPEKEAAVRAACPAISSGDAGREKEAPKKYATRRAAFFQRGESMFFENAVIGLRSVANTKRTLLSHGLSADAREIQQNMYILYFIYAHENEFMDKIRRES